MMYPDAVHDESEIVRLVEAAGDVLVNAFGTGFRTRSRPATWLIPLPQIKAPEVARFSCPRTMSLSALMGMKKALDITLQYIETGDATDATLRSERP
jgi:hypothetical protein